MPATRVLFLCVGASVASVRLAAQCPDGTPPPCATGRAVRAAAPARGSIAVLPFANRSPDTADAYLADEFPEQITGRLSRIAQLHVTSATAVAAQWRRTPDALASARALRVEWLVTGTLRRAQGQISASVELVRAATGEQAWSSLMRRSDGDIGAIEAAVAESVAVAAAGRLAPGQAAALSRRDSRDPEAYRLYLYGRSLVQRRTAGDIASAVTALTEAVRRDSGFAAAWARLGHARSLQTQYGNADGLSDDSLMALARAAADRALRLDSTIAETWFADGVVSLLSGDLESAWRSLNRAARLDPLSGDIEFAIGYLYSVDLLVMPALAAPHLRRSLELNPDLRNSWRHLGLIAGVAGDQVEALALLDSSLAHGPWAAALVDRAWVRYLRGDVAGALADQAAADGLGLPPPSPFAPVQISTRRAVYALARGDSSAARALLARSDPLPRPVVAMVLGDREAALEALEQLRALPEPLQFRCASATPCSASLRTWRLLQLPLFVPLRGEPRFQRLLEATRPHVPWLESGPAR